MDSPSPRTKSLSAPDATLSLERGTTRELPAGSGFAYEDRGIVRLKGIPAPRQVFALASSADEKR